MLLACGLAVATVCVSTSTDPVKHDCKTNDKENWNDLDKTRDTAKDVSYYHGENTHL